MDLEQIHNIIEKLHGGASYNVKYVKDGLVKVRPVRLGVRYSNTKQMAGLTAKPLPGHGRWVIDRYVYEDDKGYKLRITNGAFGSDPSKPIVQCIKLENVLAIIRKGIEL